MINYINELLQEVFESNKDYRLLSSEIYNYISNNNEYLKDYINSHYYQNDRHQTAKHVAELSYKLNREFTNKYDRY